MTKHEGFEECDTNSVFSNVTAKITSPELGALWTRIQGERERYGVDASISYLEAEFTKLKRDLTHELERLESEDL